MRIMQGETKEPQHKYGFCLAFSSPANPLWELALNAVSTGSCTCNHTTWVTMYYHGCILLKLNNTEWPQHLYLYRELADTSGLSVEEKY